MWYVVFFPKMNFITSFTVVTLAVKFGIIYCVVKRYDIFLRFSFDCLQLVGLSYGSFHAKDRDIKFCYCSCRMRKIISLGRKKIGNVIDTFLISLAFSHHTPHRHGTATNELKIHNYANIPGV